MFLSSVPFQIHVLTLGPNLGQVWGKGVDARENIHFILYSHTSLQLLLQACALPRQEEILNELSF